MSRIWIINHAAVPPTESGGTRHYTLAHELMKHGFAPTVIAGASNYQTGKPRALPEGARAHLQVLGDVPFLWLRTAVHGKSSLKRLGSMLHFAWLILTNQPRRQLDAPDIIFGSSPDLFAAAAACFLARHLKVPFVLEVRDLWPESLMELRGYAPWHPLIVVMRGLERYVYRHADLIVTVLSDAAPYFAARGAKASNVLVIPNGVDQALLEKDITATPRSNDMFTVLYAGAHGLPNQLETLIEAADILQHRAHAPAVNIILIGEGTHKVALQEMAAARGLKHVMFLPSVPKQEIAERLAGADACYLQFKDSPLYQWGVSPNKLYDYLLAAKPVLYAANVPHNPVQIANAGVSLKPGDAAALADAIIALAALPTAERSAMGARGRAYVLEHHNFTTLGVRLAAALKPLLRQ